MTDREQATLPENDAEPDERDVESAATAPAEDDLTAERADTSTEAADVTEAPVPEPEAEPETLEWAEATGAFVLGVLPPDDAAAAAQEFARSATLRAEVATLLPVADILLSLYQQTQPAPTASTVTAPVAAPTAERQTAETARRVERPRTDTISRPALPSLGGIRPSSILIGLFALIAAIGVLWALSLNDRVATKDDEINALKRQVEQFRQAANASAFTLEPTASAPDGARGTVFYSLADSRVIIDVSGLPELDQDRVYQVWFQRTGSNAWEPGPTFLVNQQGESVQRLPGETPSFARIAVSEEPAPGSSEPSGDFLLEGALSGGNG